METKSKPDIDVKDDLRQALIVCKYEIMKFLSGKKILIFGIIDAIILALITVALVIARPDNLTPESGVGMFIGFSQILMWIGATLFSSVTLVSEFEERTSLLLFTKPIRKSSIFFGKFIAAFILNLVFIIVYYLVSSIVIVAFAGGFTPNVFLSLVFCAIYIFSLTGIAMFFSAVMKKSSSASILTFVFILLVPMIVSLVITLIMSNTGNPNPDLWFMLDSAAAVVSNSIDGNVSNGLRDALVMFVWGLVPLLAAYFVFRKREI